MSMTTDPVERAALVAGLRELADFLAANPAVAVPAFGCPIDLVAIDGTDDDQAGAVDAFASATGAEVADDRDGCGRYSAARSFGPVRYRAYAYTAASMADHEARHSYAPC